MPEQIEQATAAPGEARRISLEPGTSAGCEHDFADMVSGDILEPRRRVGIVCVLCGYRELIVDEPDA